MRVSRHVRGRPAPPRPAGCVGPGGRGGTFRAAGDEGILAWVREAHAHSKFTTSVCTGSLILGAAGVLEGKNATTHWAAVPMLDASVAEAAAEMVPLLVASPATLLISIPDAAAETVFE